MKKISILVTILFSIIMFSSPSFAGIMTELFGYKLGEECKKPSTTNDDVDVELSCTKHTNKIWEINVKLKSIDYDTLYQKTIDSIGSPTKQTPNKKSSCYSDDWYKAFGFSPPKKDLSNKYNFMGESTWETVKRTNDGSEPKYSLNIRNLVSYGCPYSEQYIDFESRITLTGNEILDESISLKEQIEKEKKNNTLDKLFN